jgi:hypothetical protein
MSIPRFAAALLLVSTAIWAADPKPAPPPAKSHAPAKPVKATTAPARSDAQIEADIRARFARSKINAEKFQVRVQGGVATIEGRTDVIQHKGVATRMAKAGGAVAVNNRVQISDAARQKARANLEEGRRRVQVKRSEPRTQAAQ